MNAPDSRKLAELYSAHLSDLSERYSQALVACQIDRLIVGSGGATLQRAVDDQYWPFKVHPTFAHWQPNHGPGQFLVIEPGKRPKLLRPAHDDYWDSPSPLVFPDADRSFDLVEDKPEALRKHLQIAGAAFIGDVSTEAALGFAASACNPPALTRALDSIRAIKTVYEILCVGEANRRAARGHARVQALFASGEHSELDLHLQYLLATAQDDSHTPYKNIVAQGPNAATLHHVHYDLIVRSGDTSLLVDAGATFHGYASDITRASVRGNSGGAQRFRELIAAMENLQRTICREIAPGLAYEELHNRSHELLAGVLLDTGIGRGSAEALVERGITRAFFPHGLGHSLGLQVHDVGCRTTTPAAKNPFLRNTSTIARGQIFTIEPGCYFIDGLLGPLRSSPDQELVSWAAVEELQPFGGIRIEDNLAVTPSGSTNLTRDNLPTAD